MKQITTYEQAVDYLFQIPKFTAKNTMEDTKAFLHLLKDPDREMKIIHVAGTNGKGSVCSYMRYILESAGFSTAVFTSPHLVDVRERFVVRGEMVSREDFLEAFLLIYHKLDWKHMEGECSEELPPGAYHPSFFEYLFFMAMILFQKEKPDYCILETGLGGRLDATNAVAQKELSVITRIGMDHMEYLGDTLPQIAMEKAGIIKSGVPVVYADTDKAVSEVFRRKAAKLGSMAYPVSKKDYSFLNFKNKTIDFSLHTRYYDYISLTLRTQARYQMENASLAVRGIEVMDQGKTITKEQIEQGISRCFWQGRMEEVLPQVFVDGAHNSDGIRAFLETVSADEWQGQRRLLFGVVKDKDYKEMCSLLAESHLFSGIDLVPINGGRRLSPETLEEILTHLLTQAWKPQIKVHQSVEDAWKEILSAKQEDQRIYVAGSLYLVGEIKEICDRVI